MVRQWSLPNYFASKTENFAALLFFLGHAIKNSSGQMRQISRRMEIIHPIEDWLKTGWARESQTRTRLVDSLICIRCSLESNAFSVLHYVMVTLHYSMFHRFEMFYASGTIAHGSISCRLAASRLCEAARWQLLLLQEIYPKLELSLLGIPANRAHPKQDSTNSNNWLNNTI